MIKANCPCGAILEYQGGLASAPEVAEEYRALDFYKAHAGCLQSKGSSDAQSRISTLEAALRVTVDALSKCESAMAAKWMERPEGTSDAVMQARKALEKKS